MAILPRARAPLIMAAIRGAHTPVKVHTTIPITRGRCKATQAAPAGAVTPTNKDNKVANRVGAVDPLRPAPAHKVPIIIWQPVKTNC